MPVLTLIQGKEEIKLPFEGTPVLGELLKEHGYATYAPCGGKGRCGRCTVELYGAVSEPDEAEIKHGKRLCCRSVLLGDAIARLLPCEESFARIETGTAPVNGSICGYGAAVDIGTTTVVLKVFDEQGECIGRGSDLNPQRVYGADVISRIDASLHGKGEEMQRLITDCVFGLLKSVCDEGGVSLNRIEKMVITGNTAMLYLLMGHSCESISRAPFTVEHGFGIWTELFGIPTYIPPVMNAFVGADITCALLASGLCEGDATSLLCDMGTNGEIVLWRGNKLYVTSCAAGPAFEGADISCGVGAVPGAIDKVWSENGRVAAHTIDGAPPVGLCGSGLVDAVAAFLENGVIDNTGYAEEDMLICGVKLLPEDVRSFQLAKAAVCAGIQTLLDRTDTAVGEVEGLVVAGGFGGGLDMRSASLTGLIPSALARKAHFIGNGALSGAAALLFDGALIHRARQMARGAEHVELGGSDDFGRMYIENIGF